MRAAIKDTSKKLNDSPKNSSTPKSIKQTPSVRQVKLKKKIYQAIGVLRGTIVIENERIYLVSDGLRFLIWLPKKLLQQAITNPKETYWTVYPRINRNKLSFFQGIKFSDQPPKIKHRQFRISGICSYLTPNIVKIKVHRNVQRHQSDRIISQTFQITLTSSNQIQINPNENWVSLLVEMSNANELKFIQELDGPSLPPPYIKKSLSN